MAVQLFTLPAGQDKPKTKKRFLPVTYFWRRAAFTLLFISLFQGAVIWQMLR